MILAATPRMVLRRFVDADVVPMTKVFGDADVMRFGDGPRSVEWVRAWIAARIADYDALGFGLWAVVLKESERPIGYCGLTRYEDINGSTEIELGYRLAKRYWGRGLATEAATAVRDLAFQQLGLTRIISLIDPDNGRSIRVAEKLGMIHSDNVMLTGYSHPDRVYSLLVST